MLEIFLVINKKKKVYFQIRGIRGAGYSYLKWGVYRQQLINVTQPVFKYEKGLKTRKTWIEQQKWCGQWSKKGQRWNKDKLRNACSDKQALEVNLHQVMDYFLKRSTPQAGSRSSHLTRGFKTTLKWLPTTHQSTCKSACIFYLNSALQ